MLSVGMRPDSVELELELYLDYTIGEMRPLRWQPIWIIYKKFAGALF